MRAVRVHGWGSVPVVEEIPEPVPGPGETVVQIAAAAVGHYDLSVARGEHEPRPSLPYVPGTDGAGTVLSSAAHEAGTPVRISGGGLGLRRDGTWAEQVAVPDGALESLPEGVDPALAASFSLPATAAFTAVELIGRLEPGERVAVTGAAGAVGSLAVQLAQRGGAKAVVGVVSRDGKAKWVPAGAKVVVGRGPAVVEQLRHETGGIDLLVDTVGGPDLPALLAAMAPGGRVVLVGYTAGTTLTLDLPALIDLDVSLHPLNLFRSPARSREATATVLNLLGDGEIDLPVTRFRLEDVTSAVEGLATGNTVGRVVLLPTAPEDPPSCWR